MPENKWETANSRAIEDTKTWIRHSSLAFILLPIIGGIMSAIFIFPDDNFWFLRALLGGVGSVATLLIIFGFTYLTHIFIAPYRQRNEARIQILKLKEQKQSASIIEAQLLALGRLIIESQNIKMQFDIALREGKNLPQQNITAFNQWQSDALGFISKYNLPDTLLFISDINIEPTKASFLDYINACTNGKNRLEAIYAKVKQNMENLHNDL